ncbi:hypothetical protein ACS0TY_018016 [Phlomoides rotata]
MDSTFAKLSLLEDEGDELLLEPDIDANVEPIVEFSVVGRFLTDQAIPFAIMKSRMASAWKPKKGVSIKEIGSGRYLFQFYHLLDVKRVIDGFSWAFGNHPLVVHQLQTGELPLTVPLNLLAFWVQVYGLPVGYFSENIGLGHMESFCDVLFDAGEGEVKREWGTFLKAPDRRNAPVYGDRWILKGQSANSESGEVEHEAEGEEHAGTKNIKEAKIVGVGLEMTVVRGGNRPGLA